MPKWILAAVLALAATGAYYGPASNPNSTQRDNYGSTGNANP